MRNIFNTIKTKAADLVCKVSTFGRSVAERFTAVRYRARVTLCSVRGENYVDSGVKILIAVVIGALLLGGLYALFGDTILPTVTEKVEEMFEFKG